MYPQFINDMDCNWSEESYVREVRRCYSEMIDDGEIEDEELEDELIKLEANKQRITDKNNYLRKVNRENYRQYNTLEESYNNYIDILSKIDLSKFKIVEHKSK
jgi:collagenase-like PrtC family protease